LCVSCRCNCVDPDGDGSIGEAELAHIFKTLGHEPSDEELTKMVKEVDLDGNGTIDFVEFATMMAKQIKEAENSKDEDLAEAFKIFCGPDKDVITAAGLRQVMTDLGEKMTDEELDECLREADGAAADGDGDGEVSFEEFKAMMARG
jgi:calmodulin